MTAGRLSALLSLLVLGKAPSPVWASVFSPGAPWVGWPPSAFEDCSSRTAKQRPSENQQIRGLLAQYVYCVVGGSHRWSRVRKFVMQLVNLCSPLHAAHSALPPAGTGQTLGQQSRVGRGLALS